MVTISGTYQDGLRCTATHDSSGAELITDAPKDNFGQGRSFSPTDLLATSLATCIVTTMGIWAQRNNVDLGSATFKVTKEMSTTSPRRVARLAVTIHIATTIPPEQRERLEAAGRACPVHQSLHPDVKCDIAFTWA